MDTDPVVFGTPADLMVLKEDIEQFLASEEIGATTIMIYMRYVYLKKLFILITKNRI